jgi:hypothetical protein
MTPQELEALEKVVLLKKSPSKVKLSTDETGRLNNLDVRILSESAKKKIHRKLESWGYTVPEA